MRSPPDLALVPPTDRLDGPFQEKPTRIDTMSHLNVRMGQFATSTVPGPATETALNGTQPAPWKVVRSQTQNSGLPGFHGRI
jgi:hypothetical protein